jgi:spore maturation protein CgeB
MASTVSTTRSGVPTAWRAIPAQDSVWHLHRTTIRASVRIAVIDTYYPMFLERLYASRGMSSCSYKKQLDSLLNCFFGTSDAYSRHLGELGHETIDIVANCLPLQQRWATENRRPGGLRRLRARIPLISAWGARDSFLERVAIAQIEAHRADVVYVQNLSFFARANLDLLRSQGRFVAGQIASELPAEKLLRGFDLLLTSFPHYVARFRAMGMDSEYLQIGFYSRILEQLRREGTDPRPDGQRPHALTFVGGLDPTYPQHRAGVELLERVATRLPLTAWGYGAERLSTSSPLRTAYRGEAWGIDMYRVLAQSRVALNRHGPVAEGYANNMRLFEATGMGSLLLTESAPNLSHYFEPGREVVSYDGANDLMDKLEHYLEHDDERRAIAAAGQARTLRDHTYAKLMVRLADILEARLR